MKTSTFTIFILSLCVFFTACKEKQIQIVDKTDAVFELQSTEAILEEIGEFAIRDTALYSRFICFYDNYLSRSFIYIVKNFKGDSVSLFTFAKCFYGSQNDFGFIGHRTNPTQILKSSIKVNEIQNPKNSEILFKYFDSLVNNKTIEPLGKEIQKDRSGDYVDGKFWLFYFDGKQFYRFSSLNSNKIQSELLIPFFERNVKIENVYKRMKRDLCP